MRPKPLTVFWGNERVSYEALIGTLREETLGRLAGEGRVLLLQDTTSLDFSGHQAVEGLGRLERGGGWGLFAHSTLAVSEAGVPLGVVAQRTWVRPDSETGKSAKRHETAFADKESYKWVDGLCERGSGQVWAHGITVCDREAHIYEFLAATLDAHLDFVVRATKGRSFTVDGQELFEAITFAPVMAQRLIQVKRHPNRPARQASVQLRFGSLTVRRPRRATTPHETLTVQVVEVIETQPPPGEKAIHWLLLTSLPVTDLAQADQMVTFYTYRWLIERFHFTLKSGCKLEDSQLRSAARLKRLLAVYSGAAWHLLWLTYLARQTPDASCTVALSSAEWHALFAFIHRTQRLPASPPTLLQAVRWIAQLGGFLGRSGDGQPGLKVLWRGWSRLQDIAHTWSIVHPSPDVGNA
jgi:Transposase Tn5 dimerisation domain